MNTVSVIERWYDQNNQVMEVTFGVKVKFTKQAAEDLKEYHGIDIEDEMVKILTKDFDISPKPSKLS